MILPDTCFLSDKPREGRSVGTLAGPGRAAMAEVGDPDSGSRLRRLAARPASLSEWLGVARYAAAAPRAADPRRGVGGARRPATRADGPSALDASRPGT